MPIRQGRAKLWFKTKQQIDQYDDRMISNIELTTSEEKDDNYCLMFVRQKREAFLTGNQRAREDLEKVRSRLLQLQSILGEPESYIRKYLQGKRDHTIDRYWNIQKGMFAWGIGYLLLRELPIRNFYARASIMFVAFAMYFQRKSSINPFQPMIQVIRDQFTDKDIRNYQAYTDMTQPTIPRSDNKIHEAKVWQLNQPAYMREFAQGKVSQTVNKFVKPKQKVVAWDGTFNMPLEGLAHPLHKDAKHIDFVWWDY